MYTQSILCTLHVCQLDVDSINAAVKLEMSTASHACLLLQAKGALQGVESCQLVENYIATLHNVVSLSHHSGCWPATLTHPILGMHSSTYLFVL